MALEVMTVADDEIVAFDGARVVRRGGLAPATTYDVEGIDVRTLPAPGGELLATVATVNDVHFGETEAGALGGHDVGPTFRSGPGEPPYPELMNRAAVAEIAALRDGAGPDAVVVKGDLTSDGSAEQVAAFLDCYGGAFGDRLTWVQGNHESYHEAELASPPFQEVTLPGVVLAVLDTSVPRSPAGSLDADQLEWLDELGARADRPVLVLGHHHVWRPDADTRADDFFGIAPAASEALVEVVARRPSLVAYAAGHTHRNRVVRITATGDVPWIEVACVKDYPGAWAEYRVHEGGILQLVRRIADPAALDWTERTRHMFSGLYAEYALGSLDDRCLLVRPR